MANFTNFNKVTLTQFNNLGNNRDPNALYLISNEESTRELTNVTISNWGNNAIDSGMRQAGFIYTASISGFSNLQDTDVFEITYTDAQIKSGNYSPVFLVYGTSLLIFSKVNASITLQRVRRLM